MSSIELKVIGILLAVAALFGAWEWEKRSLIAQGVAECHAEIAKAQLAAEEQGRATALTTFKLQEVRDADSLRINGRLADALQRLRSRPATRVPPASAPASAGSTGRELSGPDAEFLERESSRADLLRSDLETCRGWIKAVITPKVKP